MAHLCDLDRTYIFGIERKRRNLGICNIHASLTRWGWMHASCSTPRGARLRRRRRTEPARQLVGKARFDG